MSSLPLCCGAPLPLGSNQQAWWQSDAGAAGPSVAQQRCCPWSIQGTRTPHCSPSGPPYRPAGGSSTSTTCEPSCLQSARGRPALCTCRLAGQRVLWGRLVDDGRCSRLPLWLLHRPLSGQLPVALSHAGPRSQPLPAPGCPSIPCFGRSVWFLVLVFLSTNVVHKARYGAAV